MALITSSVSGMYSLEITAANINFTGYMQITIVDTDSAGIEGLPFFRSFIITSANVVDTEYGTDKLQVDQVELGSSTQSNTDLKDLAEAYVAVASKSNSNSINSCQALSVIVVAVITSSSISWTCFSESALIA